MFQEVAVPVKKPKLPGPPLSAEHAIWVAFKIGLEVDEIYTIFSSMGFFHLLTLATIQTLITVAIVGKRW
jgi:hypothetical protein